MAGWPEFSGELLEICKRESPGHDCRRTVGAHGNDAHEATRRFYEKAVARGWLDPTTCTEHRADTHEEMKRFGVRGSHGLAAGYSLRFLSGPCLAPEVLDTPLISAFAATRRAMEMCARLGACTRAKRHSHWVGARTAARRAARREVVALPITESAVPRQETQVLPDAQPPARAQH
jgi:hypothetical protein